jgi:hypothetical protein
MPLSPEAHKEAMSGAPEEHAAADVRANRSQSTALLSVGADVGDVGEADGAPEGVVVG